MVTLENPGFENGLASVVRVQNYDLAELIPAVKKVLT